MARTQLRMLARVGSTRTRAISKWLVGAFVLGQVVPSFVVWRVVLFVQMLALTSK